MNEEIENTELSDVLAEIETSEIALDAAALRRLVALYPQFEKELLDYAAFDAALEFAVVEHEPQQDVVRIERSRRILARVLDEKFRAPIAVEQIVSLKKAAAAQNLSLPEFASRAGLSRQLLLALEMRAVRAETVSRRALEKIARVLNTSIAALQAFFDNPVQLLENTDYKSADQPAAGEKQDFAELVKNDLKLTAAQKRDLLD